MTIAFRKDDASPTIPRVRADLGNGGAGAVRAVAQALGQNPIPLVIPCHRVVASDGIGGFSAEQGIKPKQKMLDLEASVFAPTPGA